MKTIKIAHQLREKSLKLIVVTAGVICLTVSAFGQDQAARSSAILQKLHQLVLLQTLLPVNFTPKQLAPILDAIDKAKDLVKKTEDNEYKILTEASPKIDDLLKKALEKDEVPDPKSVMEINNTFAVMTKERELYGASNTQTVFEAVMANSDAGQKAVMANLAIVDPNVKDMTQDAKIKAFVGEYLLDPLAYDLLVKISIPKPGSN